jgi:hypothetical protein
MTEAEKKEQCSKALVVLLRLDRVRLALTRLEQDASHLLDYLRSEDISNETERQAQIGKAVARWQAIRQKLLADAPTLLPQDPRTVTPTEEELRQVAAEGDEPTGPPAG